MPTKKDLAALLAYVPTNGSTVGNVSARMDLGWNEARYNAAQDSLAVDGTLLKGQGRGGTVRRTGNTPPPQAAALPRGRTRLV